MATASASSAVLPQLRRLGLPVALLAVIVFFAATTPTFLLPANLLSVLVNNFTLLALVAIAMTLPVASGGIDLSVGTAVDFASLAFVAAIAAGHGVGTALLLGLAGGIAVGAFNAFLIAGIGITPFLATLGTLFIGRSLQQLATGGGNPIYLLGSQVPAANVFIGHGDIAGLPVPLVVAGISIAAAILLGSTVFGRVVRALGAQPGVAWYSGLRVGRTTALVYVAGAACSAVAGILLSCTVNAYVPSSGNAFLLNAIGATFVGTTLDRAGRPNVAGTLLGVLLLGLVANGLLLIGWNFYWQQVGTGVLVFLVLALSFAGRARNASS